MSSRHAIKPGRRVEEDWGEIFTISVIIMNWNRQMTGFWSGSISRPIITAHGTKENNTDYNFETKLIVCEKLRSVLKTSFGRREFRFFFTACGLKYFCRTFNY